MNSDATFVMKTESEIEWKDISRRLRPYLLNKLGSPADADDALQNALLGIHRGLAGLERPERLIPWMYRIAQNAATDQLRDRSRHSVARGEAQPEVAATPEAENGALKEVARYVASLVANLDEPYRSALELTEIDGLTQKAAAEALGVSLTAMKSRVQRGRERLRRELEKCCAIALDGRRGVVDCEPKKANQGCC